MAFEADAKNAYTKNWKLVFCVDKKQKTEYARSTFEPEEVDMRVLLFGEKSAEVSEGAAALEVVRGLDIFGIVVMWNPLSQRRELAVGDRSFQQGRRFDHELLVARMGQKNSSIGSGYEVDRLPCGVYDRPLKTWTWSGRWSTNEGYKRQFRAEVHDLLGIKVLGAPPVHIEQ